MPYTNFPLFQSHLDLAHNYWERLIYAGDHVIDATCGNGHDTLKLATLALAKDDGKVWGFDIQAQALKKTKDLLSSHLTDNQLTRITLLNTSHVEFPRDISKGSIKLIVYNLGYLPGGDKSVTTHVNSTLESLLKAQDLVQAGGAISITCYPGHLEGADEQALLLEQVATWVPQAWNCTFHQWPNRHKAPSLLLLQKQ